MPAPTDHRQCRREPLNGMAGADTLQGGLGHDIYVVDNAGDNVIETSARRRHRPGAELGQLHPGPNVENLTLLGTGGDQRHRQHARQPAHRQQRRQSPQGPVNANDTLDGGAGSDELQGGAGNDSLRGGTDADRLRVQHRAQRVRPMSIPSSTSSTDVDEILLENAVFTGLAAGAAQCQCVPAGHRRGRMPTTASSTMPPAGDLFFDSDGTGAAAAVLSPPSTIRRPPSSRPTSW